MSRRINSVLQPPPTAKCGEYAGSIDGGTVGSRTGSVDTKKSPRSLVKLRSVVTATGSDAVNDMVPDSAELLKGHSVRNFAICVLAASVNEPERMF